MDVRARTRTGRRLLRGSSVLPDGSTAEALVVIEDGRLVDVVPRWRGTGGSRVPGTLLPGMIDVHVHGAGGASVMDGPASIHRMARTLARHGVTSFLATAVSAPLADLVRFVRDVAVATDEQADARARGVLDEAAILGAHLEGPAISMEFRGAHDPAALIAPEALLEAWDEPGAWRGVRTVTLAPELPGGQALVERLASEGRIASIGHTQATYEQAWAAFDAGARSVTHLFDRMTGLHHRAPGVVGAALTHPEPSVELIADRLHVVPEVWPIVWRTVGERLVLVSDGAAPAGAGAGGADAAASGFVVRDGGVFLRDGTLAGSTTLLDGSLRNVVAAGLGLGAASHAVSVRPAVVAGAPAKGRLEAGADADLIVVDDAGSLLRVMIAGQWLDDGGVSAAR